MSVSVMFQPLKIGPMTIPNRFMRSATCEALADKKTGVPTQKLLNVTEKYSKGHCGLIIPGYVYVDRKGFGMVGQAGFENEAQVNPWGLTIKNIHSNGSKIMFQLVHCGRASMRLIRKGPNQLSVAEIDDLIEKFRKSAILAEKIGADGVQLHAAHGYLLSQFLTPSNNLRKDKYGGNLENRMRIVQEIVTSIRSSTSPNFAIGVKMNGHDCIEKGGVTPEIASEFVHKLQGVDLFEVSCGYVNPMTTIRMEPFSKTFYSGIPWYGKPIVKHLVKKANPVFPYFQGYTLGFTEFIKKNNPGKIVASVGGHRELGAMENAIKNGQADVISLSRPFMREPDLVKKFEDGKIKQVGCVSCGECIMKLPFHGFKCYYPEF